MVEVGYPGMILLPGLLDPLTEGLNRLFRLKGVDQDGDIAPRLNRFGIGERFGVEIAIDNPGPRPF